MLFCLKQHIPFQNATRQAAQDDSTRDTSQTVPEIEVIMVLIIILITNKESSSNKPIKC